MLHATLEVEISCFAFKHATFYKIDLKLKCCALFYKLTQIDPRRDSTFLRLLASLGRAGTALTAMLISAVQRLYYTSLKWQTYKIESIFRIENAIL